MRRVLSLCRSMACAVFCAASPGVAWADLPCRTLGWATAVGEAATRDSYSGGAAARLRSLLGRYDLAQIDVALRAELSAREALVVTGLLHRLQDKVMAGQYRSNPSLMMDARRTLRILERVACDPAAPDLPQQRGAGTDGSGGRDSGGSDFIARSQAAFFTRAMAERIAFGAMIVASICAIVAVFRFSLVLQRKHKRHVCGIDCVVSGATTDQPARLHDISETGCKLGPLSGTPVGAPVTLRVAGVEAEARVRWASGGSTGLRFLHPQSRATLQQILDAAERREHERSRAERMRKLAALAPDP